MVMEFNTLIEWSTWELIPRLFYAYIFTFRLVFTIKYGPFNNVHHYKACLVVDASYRLMWLLA